MIHELIRIVYDVMDIVFPIVKSLPILPVAPVQQQQQNNKNCNGNWRTGHNLYANAVCVCLFPLDL